MHASTPTSSNTNALATKVSKHALPRCPNTHLTPTSNSSHADALAAHTHSYGKVVGARVMTNQCYGFVEFSTPEEAQEALLAVRAGAVTLEGRNIRADWAQVSSSIPGGSRVEEVVVGWRSKSGSNPGEHGVE